jgi:hypothetical protein
MSAVQKLKVSELDRLAVVAQSLDNQWVPPSLLKQMLKKGQNLSDVRSRLRHDVRAEYIRALICSPQVLVNRAFLYNNPVVFEDFTRGASNREAFLGLLTSGAIVQFLVAEKTPVDPPRFLNEQSTPNYSLLREGWEAWTGVAGEALVHSLRFSWDEDDTNQKVVRQRLASAFTQRAQSLVNLDGPTLANDLKVDPARARDIKRRLVDVSNRCAELAAVDEFATRESLYKEFVTAPQTDPAIGQYDLTRPHCEYVKQLIDLAYNVNLAVGLETFAQTPSDGLNRTVLQEWGAIRMGDAVTAEQITAIITGVAFDFVQGALFIDTFGKLTLRDVLDVRGSQQWDRYTSSMDALVASPLTMFDNPESGANAVVGAYIDLLAETTRVAMARKRPGLPESVPRDLSVVLSVEVAGAVLEYQYLPEGLKVVIAGAVAAPLLAEAAKVCVRLGVRGRANRKERKALESALDTRTQLLNGWVKSAGSFWRQLVAETQDYIDDEVLTQILRPRPTASIDGDPDLPADVANALD